MQGFQPVQDVPVAVLAFRENAFAGDFMTVRVKHDALDFCAAQIDADAKHDFSGKSFANYLPQQFLYFLPLPQGQGSLRPTFGPVRTGLALAWASTAAAASLTTSLAFPGEPPPPPNALVF